MYINEGLYMNIVILSTRFTVRLVFLRFCIMATIAGATGDKSVRESQANRASCIPSGFAAAR